MLGVASQWRRGRGTAAECRTVTQVSGEAGALHDAAKNRNSGVIPLSLFKSQFLNCFS